MDWGCRTAESLWNSYTGMGVDFTNTRLLDFGCAWGYFCRLALERGCSLAVGVDIQAHWARVEDQAYLDHPGLRLHDGDILSLDALAQDTFDVIVSSGTLFLLDSEYLDKVLAWFFEHLAPGGEALLRTRCMTAKSYNDLGTRLNVPGAQLLFSRRIIDDVLTRKGHAELKSHLSYTGATWILACRGAGFEVVDVKRHSNDDVVRMAAGHRSKTRFIEPLELKTGEIMMHLRKPIEVRDLSGIRKV
jgi:hypothetical protein